MTKAPTDIRSLARSHGPLALKTLAAISQRGKTEAARVAASIALLDRGYGKPTQTIAGDPEGTAIAIVQRIERVIVPAKGE